MSFDPTTGFYLARCEHGHQIRISPVELADRAKHSSLLRGFRCAVCEVLARADADFERTMRLLETDGVSSAGFE
jgi:hypothetical protein